MNRIPAECFPLGVLLSEEMHERGWSSADVAARMSDEPHARAVWQLTVDLILNCSDMAMMLDQGTADALGRAFGVSPQFFINHNNSYQDWCRANGLEAAPAP